MRFRGGGVRACSSKKIKENKVECVLRTVLKAFFWNLLSLESPVSNKRTFVAHGGGGCAYAPVVVPPNRDSFVLLKSGDGPV